MVVAQAPVTYVTTTTRKLRFTSHSTNTQAQSATSDYRFVLVGLLYTATASDPFSTIR